jgi:hypothetical protein
MTGACAGSPHPSSQLIGTMNRLWPLAFTAFLIAGTQYVGAQPQANPSPAASINDGADAMLACTELDAVRKGAGGTFPGAALCTN